jgi:hypothetical protein
MTRTGGDSQADKRDNDDHARKPLLVAVIRSLCLPEGSHGLDAGRGVGMQALLLADEVAPEGHVAGVDCRAEFACPQIGTTCCVSVTGSSALGERRSVATPEGRPHRLRR